MASVPIPHPTSRTFLPFQISNSANFGMCGSTKYLRCSTSSKYVFEPICALECLMLHGRSSQNFLTSAIEWGGGIQNYSNLEMLGQYATLLPVLNKCALRF